MTLSEWTRRDTLSHAIIGSAFSPSIRSVEPLGARHRDDRAGRIGLFVNASGHAIPAANDIAETSGYHVTGIGAARYIHDPSVDPAFVRTNPLTAFISLDGRCFRLSERWVDILQVGAVGDGKVDDTAACQAAMDFVERAGGGVVAIPPGEYRITASLTLPGRVELIGAGQAAILRVVGCDGLIIASSDTIGPRRVANFWLYGASAESFSAIVCDLVPPRRAQGVVFDGVYLSFFGTGVRARGLWHTTFRSVTMNNVHKGYVLVDQNVKVLIDDGRVTRGDLLKGDGASVGIQVGDGEHGRRPEDVQIVRTLVYGFAKAIVWRTALFGSVTGCDLDACAETGLELVTADGGFSFRDNWIQMAPGTGARIGVNGVALGYLPQPGRVSIVDNHIGQGVAAGGYGIFLGRNQANVSITGNSVAGQWEQGLRIDGAAAVVCSANRIGAPVWIGRSRQIAWADNFVAGGVTLIDNADASTGRTFVR